MSPVFSRYCSLHGLYCDFGSISTGCTPLISPTSHLFWAQRNFRSVNNSHKSDERASCNFVMHRASKKQFKCSFCVKSFLTSSPISIHCCVKIYCIFIVTPIHPVCGQLTCALPFSKQHFFRILYALSHMLFNVSHLSAWNLTLDRFCVCVCVGEGEGWCAHCLIK